MAAIAQVPRHAFVPRMEEAHAYRNEPLPIGLGQTISQPYIVAVMTDQALDGSGGGAVTRVLEVGTGSGYQAAVLAEADRKSVVEGKSVAVRVELGGRLIIQKQRTRT